MIKSSDDKKPNSTKKELLSSKNAFEKYKIWNSIKFKKELIVTNSNEQVVLTKELPEISAIDVAKETEWLKFKMGKYLANNKKCKLTLPIFFKKYWRGILIILSAALIFNFGIQTFLSRADTIPSGVTGIPTLLQYIFPQLKRWFALIYLACNIPLFLIFWRHLKRSFLWMTVLFMIFQILVNLLFTEIQPLQNFVLHRLELVPMDTETVRNYLYAAFDQNGDKVLSHTHFNAHDYREFLLSLQNQYPSAFENLAFKLQDFKIENPNFWVNAKTLATRILEIANTNKESLSHTETLAYWYDTGKTWPVLIYGALGAIFVGAGVALSWKAGGSTGGTDIVAYYFLSKTKKSVGHILSIVAIFTAIIFLVIYKFVKPNPDGVIIGVREISTFSYIVVSNLVVNKLYPKYKKIKMTIISSEPQKIIAYFNLINYWHSYRIVRFKSGYTGKYGFKIETVILLMEAKNLSDDLKLIDQNVWISETKVDRVTGKFNTTYVE